MSRRLRSIEQDAERPRGDTGVAAGVGAEDRDRHDALAGWRVAPLIRSVSARRQDFAQTILLTADLEIAIRVAALESQTDHVSRTNVEHLIRRERTARRHIDVDGHIDRRLAARAAGVSALEGQTERRVRCGIVAPHAVRQCPRTGDLRTRDRTTLRICSRDRDADLTRIAEEHRGIADIARRRLVHLHRECKRPGALAAGIVRARDRGLVLTRTSAA